MSPEILSDITIMNTQREHGQGVYDTVRLAYGVPLDEECENCIDAHDVAEQLARFPEGQFVAVYTEEEPNLVVGMAATMRTNRPPTNPPRKWIDEIGSTGIANHNPYGEWLYGVEMSVRPDFRLQGIGTALYHARFELVKRLGLKGWYAGGMLMGYRRYRREMSVREYGEKVINREIIDPTVTMQMNRGFEAWDVIEDYLDEPDAGNGAVLIVWKNPEYDET
ncbi:MAG: GNAT family N-acetyltransferase [Chloroflexi bacterium]|nr:GNAT family N-acetyltransferase [Chloroflexota bacterium]